jgi:phenylalanyl-tRNA synthetase alpha subunit
MNAQKPATLGDLLHGQDPRIEISKLRGDISILEATIKQMDELISSQQNAGALLGEISILKEELQRVKYIAEQEKKRADIHSDCILDMQKELKATIKQRDELILRQQSASALPPAGIDAILAERWKTHGSFHAHANCTQTLEDTFYSFKEKDHFTAVQLEALHMIFHKLGRIAAGSPHFQDHWDDIAGYATLVSRDISSRETHREAKEK